MRFIYFIFILCFIQLPSAVAQTALEIEELKLNESLRTFRQAVTVEEMDHENDLFKNKLFSFIQVEGAFSYRFKHLKSIAVLDSPDGKIRIVNWNIEYPDFSYSYGAFLMVKEANKIRIIELEDNLDAYSLRPEEILHHSQWYGALYYKIIPFENGKRTEYLLMGWDGGTTGSNFKILDVLVVGKKNIQFGSPVFVANDKLKNRVVFEYSEQAVMNMRFEEKYGRVVIDHLSPESPDLEGIFSYYVPDLSYDSYVYNGAYWQLKEDVIAVNSSEFQSKSFIQMNPRTGKLERKKLKKDWINPTNANKQEGDIEHIARTPEEISNQDFEVKEDPMKIDKKTLRKIRRASRKDPIGLSVTTGKYKKKRSKNK